MQKVRDGLRQPVGMGELDNYTIEPSQETEEKKRLTYGFEDQKQSA